MTHIKVSDSRILSIINYLIQLRYVFRPIGVIGAGSIPAYMIVGFVVLTVLRFISLGYVLLDSNVNCRENDMKKTKTTKIEKTVKMVVLFISSGIETVWAFGVAIISGQLMT